MMPLPNTPFYRAMAKGHKMRTGHTLRAHLESNDDGTWRVVRECCEER